MFCQFLNHLTERGYPVEILFEADSISDEKRIYKLEENK
jgi:nicotinic acid phosphoribosyltransferase